MLPPISASAAPSRYAKMNGIGNSILVVDRRGQAPLDGEVARELHARPGFGFDQLMALGDPRRPETTAFVDIFNADGSRAGACGNGTRCVASFLLEGGEADQLIVETTAGLLACRRDGADIFTVDMGPPHLGWHDIPLSVAVENTSAFALEPHAAWMDALGRCAAVSMGNPHAVFFLPPDGATPDLSRLGPALEHHPMFPDRANISFARISAANSVTVDVWERGAGLTRACGSAACAVVVAGARLGLLARAAAVTLPGGSLTIAWRDHDGHVTMTGAVAMEHAGMLTLAP